MKNLIATCFWLCALVSTSAHAFDRWKGGEQLLLEGIPKDWGMTRMADEIEVNGLPMLIFQIDGPQNLREASVLIAAAWAKDSWKVTTKPAGHEVQIIGIRDGWLKQANLSSSNRKTTEGYLSLSDLPTRMKADIDSKAPVLGKHLRKPSGTIILNEVRTVDKAGESIMTTMTNNFDLEQNIAFYEEDRAAEAWKVAYRRVAEGNKGTVIKFVSGENHEATYTFTRRAGQTFIVVNWITR
ncbi:hypothetical protein QN379_14545 [Glaciimonas sp. Gout2]|uniref:hypothetical protein n=2 Tax=Glaciimonas TaxID=1229970 RepID=UPI002AB424B8|nr:MULTISPECIES: hypothetical protein [unclassified Glaciimonas]MDY7547411.1 hypothetical protein [Glaciimonas sp. CA11.2]MEB0013574.1 hypothetical protein [Glaciimonas sp. Cout2]MEB0083225.1 hypothetical protein [Glaciimonas sp. Gout2]